jgi:hypothetical protein
MFGHKKQNAITAKGALVLKTTYSVDCSWGLELGVFRVGEKPGPHRSTFSCASSCAPYYAEHCSCIYQSLLLSVHSDHTETQDVISTTTIKLLNTIQSKT